LNAVAIDGVRAENENQEYLEDERGDGQAVLMSAIREAGEKAGAG
jgi:hypothetical protein